MKNTIWDVPNRVIKEKRIGKYHAVWLIANKSKTLGKIGIHGEGKQYIETNSLDLKYIKKLYAELNSLKKIKEVIRTIDEDWDYR